MDFLTAIQSEWAIRAFLTASMVGVTCGLIGTFIVLRNMALIGDALSHAILPGIYFAFIFVGYSTIGFFVGSVIAGIVSAIAITWLQQNIKTKNDAAIGIVFTAMFSIGVMGISSLNNKQGNHLDLKDFLFGNVLGVSSEDIILSGIIMVYTIVCIALFYRYFFISTFQPIIASTMGISTKAIHYFLMLILSFAVVAALRSVGVILVVAMLITPASTALLLSDKLKVVLVYSGILGFLSAVLGFSIAIALDTTPGPAMVIVSTIMYGIAALFSPLKGIVPNWWRNKLESRRIIQEDILKHLSSQSQPATESTLAQALNLSKSAVVNGLDQLRNQNLLLASTPIALSNSGAIKADGLVRAHRLWESYQVTSMGLPEDQIHPDAERMEHYLTDDILDELDEKLGFPTTDPHGSPIAMRVSGATLTNVAINQPYVISADQASKKIEAYLWEVDLGINDVIKVIKMTKTHLILDFKGKLVKIPRDVAKFVAVKAQNEMIQESITN